uniref:Sugar transporter SWEET1 n=1 Tax=Alexandrium catenella TaxID=2925 RepID=A0A7S1LKR7_ALECA
MNATAVAAAVAAVANSSNSSRLLANHSKIAHLAVKVPAPAGVSAAHAPLHALVATVAPASTTRAVIAPLRAADVPRWVEPIKVVKAMAFLSNVLLQLSPVRTVREIIRAGSTLEYDVFPMFTLFFCSLQWFFYGLVGLIAGGDAAMADVLRAYCGGVVLGAAYLLCFWRNCGDAEKRAGLAQMARGAAGLLGLEVCCAMGLAHQVALRVIGTSCAFLSIVVTASPLVAIEDVFRSQSVASMQTDMVIVCFCGSVAWAIMGFLMGDMCIAVPNCFGLVIGGLQVHLIVKFAETSPWRVETSNQQDGDTCALLQKFEKFGGAPKKPAGAAQAGMENGYEASVYLRLKIIVLMFMAHAHFVAVHYAGFAADTIREVCACLSELLAGPPKNCFRCRWQQRSNMGSARNAEEGESLGLL